MSKDRSKNNVKKKAWYHIWERNRDSYDYIEVKEEENAKSDICVSAAEDLLIGHYNNNEEPIFRPAKDIIKKRGWVFEWGGDLVPDDYNYREVEEDVTFYFPSTDGLDLVPDSYNDDIKNRSMNLKEKIDLTSSLAGGGIVGYSLAGPSGALIGAVLGGGATIFDNLCIQQRMYDKHYLTSSVFWGRVIAPVTISMAKIAGPLSPVVYVSGLALLPLIVYLNKDIVNSSTQAEEAVNLIKPIWELFDEQKILTLQEVYELKKELVNNPYQGLARLKIDIYHIYNNKLVMNLILSNLSALTTIWLDIMLINYIGMNGTSYTELMKMQEIGSKEILSTAIKASKIWGIWHVRNFLISYMNYKVESLTNEINNLIEQKAITNLLLNEENIIKLRQVKDVEDITRWLNNDLTVSYLIGTNKINPITSGKIEQFLAFAVATNLAPEMVLISYGISIMQKILSDYVDKKKREHNELKEAIEREKAYVSYDIFMNYTEMMATDYAEYNKKRYIKNCSNANLLAKKMDNVNYVKTSVSQLVELLSKLLDFMYLGNLIFNHNIKFQEIIYMQSKTQLLTPLLFAEEFFSKNIYEEITKRLNSLYDAIASNNPKHAQKIPNTKGQIIIKDYELYKEGKLILKMDNLVIKPGERVAICGPSSVGKTTWIKDINNCLGQPFTSKGYLSFPFDSNNNIEKPIYIDQEIYYPYRVNLFDMIMCRDIETCDPDEVLLVKEKIASLFRELNINCTTESDQTLDLVEALYNNSKEYKLSGGQEKKIGLIKAIMNNAKFLLIDEGFAQLDQESITKMQEAIEKYLPDAKIISVDHQFHSNNNKNFYTQIIKVIPRDNCIIIPLNNNNKMSNGQLAKLAKYGASILDSDEENQNANAEDKKIVTKDSLNELADENIIEVIAGASMLSTEGGAVSLIGKQAVCTNGNSLDISDDI